VEREGLEVELVVVVGARGGLEESKEVIACSVLGLWSDGGGETPSTGRRGGGRLSVGVASSRLVDPRGGREESSRLAEPEGRLSGVGDKFWGSKGGGSRLSSVCGERLSTVTGFFGSLIVYVVLASTLSTSADMLV